MLPAWGASEAPRDMQSSHEPAPNDPDERKKTGRRVYRDRRERPTPRLSAYSLNAGRRKLVRREREREGSYVDLYSRGMALSILWIALMNVGDTFFTLQHLQSGGIELNPIARVLLSTGCFGFVVSKCLLISLALVILALHKNFWLARVGLWVAAGAYTFLVLYHLTLL